MVFCNAGWDKTTYTAELPQIRKYGGFYVGRYEAGLAETITEFTSPQQNGTGTNRVYNLNGTPQSKAGVVPWDFIDWNHAQTNAKNMYNTASVSSGLITGTQWDVMLNKMVEKGKITMSEIGADPMSWGNYVKNSIGYTGRLAEAYYSSSGWTIYAFSGTKTGTTTASVNGNYAELLTTGASKKTERYHIFDIAGNLYEMTDECSLYKADMTQYHVIRGGDFASFGNYEPCYRYGGDDDSITSMQIGFRVVLYMR